MKKLVCITGASSGIGEATARLLAKNNFSLILCGRRQEKLQDLSGELGKMTEVKILNFDVRNKKAVFQAFSSLEVPWQDIDILVNNAGNAHGMDPIDAGNMDDWDAMIDINVKGLLYVSRAILPGMVRRKHGHVINIGSIAGKEVYPNGNVYCASKFAVDAINKGMMIDLNKHGIKVSGVNPGLVNTEFSAVRFKGDKSKSDKVYQGITPLTGHDVAELIFFIISRPHHVNIADSIIFPLAQASATVVHRE
ncbi:MAG: SDR family NAD(P)-dependent oxidoreductase [Cyclobacteriaceae bacterium]|nr:SDR family NAD(P)-dependent oxidoreductase [Cyclobacteriaceae bacterium]